MPRPSVSDLLDDDVRKEFYDRVRAGDRYTRVATQLKINKGTAWWMVDAYVKNGGLTAEEARRCGWGTKPRAGLQKQKEALATWLAKPDERPFIRVLESLGIPEKTGYAWKKDILTELEKAAVIQKGGPDPIAFDDLSDEGKYALEDFGLFRTDYLGRRSPPWSVITANKLLELYRSPEDEYAVVNVAPGLGKSTLITHDFICWLTTLERAMGIEPTILLGHRQWKKATWYVKRLRQTWMFNERLINTFGRYKPVSNYAAWSTEELLVEPLDWAKLGEKEPTITAAAYEAAVLSGRHKVNIWDDLIDKQNATTVDAREALVNWWEQEAETRMEPGGLTVLSNARYGPEDLSYSVTQQVDPEELDDYGSPRPMYHRIRFEVHDQSKCSGEHAGPWPDGCLLDPERAGWRRVHKASLQSERRFELVWQQHDTDPAGFLAERSWFEGGKDAKGAIVPGCFHPEFRFGQRPPGVEPILSAVTIDPSGSQYWAVQHFLLYPEKRHLLYRAVRRPMQAPEILYQDADQGGAYSGILDDWWKASNEDGVPFTYLIVEKNNNQRWLRQYPFFMNWASSKAVAIIDHQTDRANKPDPERGVEMLGPIYRHGQLWLPYGGYEEKLIADTYRKEATAWPEGATDDLLMGHWFFAHRMDQLAIIGFDEEPDSDEFPNFVGRSLGTAPRWAQRSLDSPLTRVS